MNRLVSIKLCTIIALVFSATIHSTAQNSEKYPVFLGNDKLPLAELFLNQPPANGSIAFAGDSIAYESGKAMRQSPRGQQAIDDADSSPEYMIRRFAKAINCNITPENSPKLLSLIRQTIDDAYLTNKKAKSHYKRIRPFIYFNEPSAIAEEEESHRKSFSFPSSHAAMSWAATLVLVELLPQYQNQILNTGHELCQSRVIVGYHFQSDIDAAKHVAAATVARLHADKAFLKAMKQARKELSRNGVKNK